MLGNSTLETHACSAPPAYQAQQGPQFAGEPSLGAARVQQCMWTGRNKADAQVPLTASHYQLLLTRKTHQWQNQGFYDPYLSTAQVRPLCCMAWHTHIRTCQGCMWLCAVVAGRMAFVAFMHASKSMLAIPHHIAVMSANWNVPGSCL